MGSIKLDEVSEYFYTTLIDAMYEVELDLAEDELYEKAAQVRDEIKSLKKHRQLERIAKYTGRNVQL